MADTLAEYFDALERLKKGRTNIVPKGTRITNDAVALEAGRGKGSIKKSRAAFSDLIAAIDQAAEDQSRSRDEVKERLETAKGSADKYRTLWEQALAREVSLLHELHEVRQQLAKLTGSKVLPIRGEKSVKQNTRERQR